MKKILFLCHGNICRSPVAEFIMKDLVDKAFLGWEVQVDSMAATAEALGMEMYAPSAQTLKKHNIPYGKHIAKKMKKEDYDNYDYIVVMDSSNKDDVMKIIGDDPANKVHLLLDYTPHPGDIEDPWYTGNFDKVYDQINDGCKGLMAEIMLSIGYM